MGDGLEVYRWSDDLCIRVGRDAMFQYGRPNDHSWSQVCLRKKPHNGFELVSYVDLEEQQKKRILAFMLDLGVDRPSSGKVSTVVHTNRWEEEKIFYPVWVDDETWHRRAEQVPRTLDQDFLETGLTWRRVLLSFSAASEQRPDDLLSMCDTLFEKQIVQPLSLREAWLKEHAEFGTWICPGPEEVDLYRSLGQRLPLLWERADLQAWVDDQMKRQG